MKKFNKAIVRTPCERMVNGLTTANLGKPDYHLAIDQHIQYIEALRKCGLDVLVLDPDNNFPDSTFVEDTALLTPTCAIIMNPGALSRRGETAEIAEVLKRYYKDIEHIHEPGTADAGDIMMVGSHFYIGNSGRTNSAGIQQLIKIVQKYGMDGSAITVDDGLHLKSGVAYLEDNHIVATSAFAKKTEFQKYQVIKIEDNESYSANCVWINGKVLVPAGFPKANDSIRSYGYETIELDMSEFRKLDGGLSCLSLRF
jgi:N-Dimethylarginine dimethylaminohydrolase